MNEILTLHQSIHGGLFFIFSVLLPMIIGLGLSKFFKRVISAVITTLILSSILGYAGVYVTHLIHTHNSYHLNQPFQDIKYPHTTNVIEIQIEE